MSHDRLNDIGTVYAVIVFLVCPLAGVWLAFEYRCKWAIVAGWIPLLATLGWLLGIG